MVLHKAAWVTCLKDATKKGLITQRLKVCVCVCSQGSFELFHWVQTARISKTHLTGDQGPFPWFHLFVPVLCVQVGPEDKLLAFLCERFFFFFSGGTWTQQHLPPPFFSLIFLCFLFLLFLLFILFYFLNSFEELGQKNNSNRPVSVLVSLSSSQKRRVSLQCCARPQSRRAAHSGAEPAINEADIIYFRARKHALSLIATSCWSATV